MTGRCLNVPERHSTEPNRWPHMECARCGNAMITVRRSSLTCRCNIPKSRSGHCFQTMKTSSMAPLTAQDVCQVLRDIILKCRAVKRACAQSWDEVFAGLFHIDEEGWHLLIFNDCGELNYCDECISPECRRCSFESVVRDGVDPFFC